MKFSVLVAGCALFALALPWSGDTAQAGSLCDFNSGGFAPLNPQDFGPAVRLRSKGPAAGSSPVVWSLTARSRFATQCPVRSITLAQHHGTACSDVAVNALLKDDEVRVNEWGKGRFELAIRRNGGSAFHPLQGPVMLRPVYVNAQGPRLIGYHADNVLVYAEDMLDPPVPVSYYVYLRKDSAKGERVRWYEIEVFSNDPECWKEIPGSPEAGTVLDGKRVAKDASGVAPKQLPSGGGGEDPPG